MRILYNYIVLLFLSCTFLFSQAQEQKKLTDYMRLSCDFTFVLNTKLTTKFGEAMNTTYHYNQQFSGSIDFVPDNMNDNRWVAESITINGIVNDEESYGANEKIIKIQYTINNAMLIDENLSASLEYDIKSNSVNFQFGISNVERRQKINDVIKDFRINDPDNLAYLLLLQLHDASMADFNNHTTSYGLVFKADSIKVPANFQIKYNGKAPTNYEEIIDIEKSVQMLNDLASGKIALTDDMCSQNIKTAIGNLTLKISPNTQKPYVYVKTDKTTNPHCLCNDSIVYFYAHTNASGGEFEKFEIDYKSTNHPVVKENQGGQKPLLILNGHGENAGRVFVTAVYKKDGKRFKSKPYEMNFCKVSKIELTQNGYNNIHPSKTNFVYSSDAPASLRIEAFSKVWYNGQKVNNGEYSIWNINPNITGYSEETFSNDTRIAFLGEGMPSSNDDFGKRNITLTHYEPHCICEAEPIEIKLFYPRDAQNNPDGTRPNWAYYWSQTSAVYGSGFQVVDEIPNSMTHTAFVGFACLGRTNEQINKNVLGRYDYYTGIVYLPTKFPEKSCPPRPNGEMDTGIDCFAQVLRHEERHREQLTQWWGKNMERYNCLDDLDGDLVPNWVEDEMEGCLKTFAFSCPDRPNHLGAELMDMEFDAYSFGWKWRQGKANKEDWSFPGKQLK